MGIFECAQQVGYCILPVQLSEIPFTFCMQVLVTIHLSYYYFLLFLVCLSPINPKLIALGFCVDHNPTNSSASTAMLNCTRQKKDLSTLILISSMFCCQGIQNAACPIWYAIFLFSNHIMVHYCHTKGM